MILFMHTSKIKDLSACQNLYCDC